MNNQHPLLNVKLSSSSLESPSHHTQNERESLRSLREKINNAVKSPLKKTQSHQSNTFLVEVYSCRVYKKEKVKVIEQKYSSRPPRVSSTTNHNKPACYEIKKSDASGVDMSVASFDYLKRHNLL